MFEFVRRPKKLCPHEDAQFCPLYIASHGGYGVSCDDGRLAEMGCAVDRRTVDYNKAVAELAKVDLDLVGHCAWRERQAQAKAQRGRNMRLSGVH